MADTDEPMTLHALYMLAHTTHPNHDEDMPVYVVDYLGKKWPLLASLKINDDERGNTYVELELKPIQ